MKESLVVTVARTPTSIAFVSPPTIAIIAIVSPPSFIPTPAKVPQTGGAIGGAAGSVRSGSGSLGLSARRIHKKGSKACRQGRPPLLIRRGGRPCRPALLPFLRNDRQSDDRYPSPHDRSIPAQRPFESVASVYSLSIWTGNSDGHKMDSNRNLVKGYASDHLT